MSGTSWHYKLYQNEQAPADRELYSKMEIGAREESVDSGTPPKQFLHGNTET
jgi:hypothetical protein